MNISRENLSELELRIKVEINQDDYQEAVVKQLKDYQKKAVVPGFRKGMAPKSLIERMYKGSIVNEAVIDVLNKELFAYIGKEKLNILGMPLAADDAEEKMDFSHETEFTFNFDIAVAPEFEIEWDKVDVVYNQVKVTAKDVEAQIDNLCRRHGRFSTPETADAGSTVYGKLVELDKKGEPKEGGVNTFGMFVLSEAKDEEQLALFLGKKSEEKVVFNPYKAFPVADIERAFHMDNATAKKFKSDVELTISGISMIEKHPVDEELFKLCFPKEEIKDADAFKKAVQKDIEASNEGMSDILYVRQVREALMAAFTAPMPEAFLKRWFLSRNDKLTAESLDADWETEYVPSLKWELIEGKLAEFGPVEPTNNQIVDSIKDILRSNDQKLEGETDEQAEARLEQAARSIAADRNNIGQIIDELYSKNLAAIFKEKAKPTIEKVSSKEFGERLK